MLAPAFRFQFSLKIAATITEKDTPIALAQKLQGKLGLKLTNLRREGRNGDRIRVYSYTARGDGRDEEFKAWIVRDEVAAAAPVDFTSTPGNKEIITSLLDVSRLDVENTQGGFRAAGSGWGSHQIGSKTTPLPPALPVLGANLSRLLGKRE